ncbi:hypothetical protein [Sinorhizobium chiapasense]|uniref:Uncharacterized protein n=1 Tax=Sinorhizobium chiapasense TaxID=501572 RepID=A0ABZ2B9Z5_9HYPH
MPDRTVHTTQGRVGDEVAISTGRKHPTIRGWNHAGVYREDYKASGKKRKPRIPIPTLRALALSGMPFDKAAALLDTSRNHLRSASIRAGVVFEGDKVTRKRKHPLDETKVVLLPETIPSEQEAVPPMNNPQEQTKQTKRNNSLRGEAMREHISTLIREYVQSHQCAPKKSWLQKTHGIAYETATRYWPSPDALGAMMATGECDRIEADPAPRATVSNQELAQVIAELVYGDTLVEGTYCDDNGQHHCDVINVDGAAYQPLIHKWRQHEADVSEILRLANELAA